MMDSISKTIELKKRRQTTLVDKETKWFGVKRIFDYK